MGITSSLVNTKLYIVSQATWNVKKRVTQQTWFILFYDIHGEEDDEEVYVVEIQGKEYYTNNEISGDIYLYLENEEVGDKIGEFDKKGIAIFN